MGVDGARVEIAIFDVTGRLVRSLGEEEYPFGDHTTIWDGANGNGRSVSNGLYFIRATVNDVSARTTKILVTR